MIRSNGSDHALDSLFAAKSSGEPASTSPDCALGESPMNGKIFFAAAVLLSIAAPAAAHHSFAMFDADKTIILKGTVKEFEWQNPLVWLEMMVVDQATGKPVKYSLEMGSVARSTY